MKKIIFIFIILINSSSIFAQFGFVGHEKENLKNLSKLWGFIKYHHPAVQNCTVNWDMELITSLKKLEGATQINYNVVVEDLINSVGPINPTNGERPPDINSVELNNLDFAWIEKANFSDSIKVVLANMVLDMRSNKHCLYEPYYEGVNFDFSKEKLHATFGQYPDLYYRTLAFFRYWNAIDYFFPYKHLMDQDWDTTFEQFVRSVIYAESQEAFHLNFREFTAHINDSHSFFSSSTFSNWQGRHFTPFKVSYIEGKTIITEIAEENIGLNVGDLILELDNVPIETVRNDLKKYAIASNEVTTQRNINNFLIRNSEMGMVLKVAKANGNEVVIDNLERSSTKYTSFHSGPFTNLAWKTIKTEVCGDVGYIDMGLLENKHLPDMMNDLWQKETIIFDIRNYPNGTLWELVDFLFNEPIHIADFTIPDPNYAGQFIWNSTTIGSVNTNEIFKGRLIILFNEQTQSQAEYTIMGLEQHPNAIKIGSQTAAADGNTGPIPIPGGILAYFTGLGTYYPDRTPTQRIGIIPDFEVKPTIEGIRNGIDEVLDFALDCQKLDELTTLNEGSNNFNLSIFPNPAQNFIKVNNTGGNKTELVIYNINGNVLLNRSISNNTIINCSQFSTGCYIVAWKNENMNNFKTQKLLKQ